MVKGLFFSLFVVLLLVLGGYILSILIANWAIQSEISAAKAQGYPITLEALAAYAVEPAPSKNSADAFLHAFGLVTREEKGIDPSKLPFAAGDSTPLKGPLSVADRTAIQTYLDAKQDALAALTDATSKGPCRFTPDARALEGKDLPYLAPVRASVQLLALAAALHASVGDANATTQSLAEEIATTRTLENESLIKSQLIRGACVRVVFGSVENALNSVDFTDAQLLQLAIALELADTPQSFERAFAGERCVAIVDFPTERLGANEKAPRTFGESIYNTVHWRSRDEEYGLHTLHALVAAASEPPYARARSYKALRSALENTPSYYPISKRMYESFYRDARVDITIMAQLRVARTAVAVQRYRTAKRTLPEGLVQLMPDYMALIPADPWSPVPLRYGKLGVRAVVYSAGENGVDDSGREDDIALTVQR